MSNLIKAFYEKAARDIAETGQTIIAVAFAKKHAGFGDVIFSILRVEG